MARPFGIAVAVVVKGIDGEAGFVEGFYKQTHTDYATILQLVSLAAVCRNAVHKDDDALYLLWKPLAVVELGVSIAGFERTMHDILGYRLFPRGNFFGTVVCVERRI